MAAPLNVMPAVEIGMVLGVDLGNPLILTIVLKWLRVIQWDDGFGSMPISRIELKEGDSVGA